MTFSFFFVTGKTLFIPENLMPLIKPRLKESICPTHEPGLAECGLEGLSAKTLILQKRLPLLDLLPGVPAATWLSGLCTARRILTQGVNASP